MANAAPITFAPVSPTVHHRPQRVAKDTWLIRELQGEGTEPFAVYMNSLVILGQEPVIIDTGTTANRSNWLDDVFSLVDPNAVRWVFLSHDDHDHTGNLAATLAICPNAKLVCTWFQMQQLAGAIHLPKQRMRWVDDGQSFVAGDRTLFAVRPPVFDAPSTRGLYDPTTGVYWASDSFATPVLQHVDDVNEISEPLWREGFTMFGMAVSPWLSIVDSDKFNAKVDRLNQFDITCLTGAHTPVITGERIAKSLAIMRELPGFPPASLPGQAQLEEMLAQETGNAA